MTRQAHRPDHAFKKTFSKCLPNLAEVHCLIRMATTFNFPEMEIDLLDVRSLRKGTFTEVTFRRVDEQHFTPAQIAELEKILKLF